MPYNAGSAIQRVTLVNAATDADITPSAGTPADPNHVVGNVSAGIADSGAPVKVGAKYVLAGITLTDGWRGDMQLDANARLLVNLGGTSANAAASSAARSSTLSTVFATSGAGSAGANTRGIGVHMFRSNGTGFDPDFKPNAVSRIPSSANTTNATSAKASAGELHQVNGYNSTATVTYLKLYNKASAPTVGTDTPFLTLAIPPSAVFSFTFDALFFSTGIAYGLTTAAADAGTTAPAAGAILGLNVVYS